MTIDKTYEIASKIFMLPGLNGFATTLNSFKISLASYIGALKSNLNAQQLEAYRSNIQVTLQAVLEDIDNVDLDIKEELGQNVYDSLGIDFVTGSQGKMLMQGLMSAIDRRDTDVASRIESNITSFLNLNAFYLSTKNLDNQFKISVNPIQKDKISIVFVDGALITKLNELSKASSEWVQIINCFARLVGENDTDIEVVSVERECLILTVTAVPTIIVAIAKCTKMIQDVILKGLEIKQKRIEIEKLEFSKINDVLDVMDKASKLNIAQETKNISAKLLSDYQIGVDVELYHEIEVAINTGVRKILKFNNKGGKLEPKLLTPSTEEKTISEEVQLLNTQVKSHQKAIEALQTGKNILLIEEGTDNSQTEEDDNEPA